MSVFLNVEFFTFAKSIHRRVDTNVKQNAFGYEE